MTLLETLKKRGLLDNTAGDELDTKLNTNKLTFYVGFDPTANSFHVGQLAIFNLMRHLQQAGHTPIALIGGVTGMIGDPGGKSKERELLNKKIIEQNIKGQRAQLEKFLSFKGECAATILNNADWLQDMTMISLLRDVGKHFSVNQMMARDTVKSRLTREGEGISYTEFSYMLLQAYDFYHLSVHHQCTLQLGGSDQWGNIVSGIDLTRRLAKKDVYGLTMPLITKSDGSKFGKSESGTIWLDADKTSPYEFYQFFLRTEDKDVKRFLNMLTDISLSEINTLINTLENEAHLRQPQRKLAEHLTEMVHGTDQLDRVQRASKAMYGGTITNLDDKTISQIFSDVPTHQVKSTVLDAGWPALDAFVESGACKSKSEARRLIQAGGAYINNIKITDTDLTINTEHLASASYLVFRTGKKNYRLVLINA